MPDAARLSYLLNHCPGFLPTRQQWEEVIALGNAVIADREHLCEQINHNATLARDEQKLRQELEERLRSVCQP